MSKPKPGFNYKCSTCNGHGEVDSGWFAPIIEKCGNCNGTGKVDWVRNIMPLKYDEEEGKWK